MRTSLVASVLALACSPLAWSQDFLPKKVGDHHDITIHVIITIRVEVVPTPGPGPLPPAPPIPPDPGPSPKPPEPKPPEPEPPAPIAAEGLHVFFQFESFKTLTKEEHSVVYSRDIRDYLNRKCPPGPDGKTKQWRMWDQDLNGYEDSKFWGDVQKRAKEKSGSKLPWVIISNGRTGYEGPLPGNADDMLRLLKKYGGD